MPYCIPNCLNSTYPTTCLNTLTLLPHLVIYRRQRQALASPRAPTFGNKDRDPTPLFIPLLFEANPNTTSAERRGYEQPKPSQAQPPRKLRRLYEYGVEVL